MARQPSAAVTQGLGASLSQGSRRAVDRRLAVTRSFPPWTGAPFAYLVLQRPYKEVPLLSPFTDEASEAQRQ